MESSKNFSFLNLLLKCNVVSCLISVIYNSTAATYSLTASKNFFHFKIFRSALIFLFCTVLSVSGYTHTIGFACLYNSNAPAGSEDFTAALETELFEFCFDHGIVATSIAPIVGSAARYKDNKALSKCFNASIDFFVVLYCEYRQAHNPAVRGVYAAVDWKSAKWKIVNFASGSTVFEKSLKLGEIQETDLIRKMKNVSRSIGDGILNVL